MSVAPNVELSPPPETVAGTGTPIEPRVVRRRDAAYRLKVGFVGAGFISQWHARAVKRIADVDLVAVCDLRRDLARQFADRHQCEDFGDIATMLESSEIDVAHILVPPQHHVRVAEELLRNGIDVLVEKPVATTPKDAARLHRVASETGRTVAVGHNFLYLDPYLKLREDLRGGVLGRVDQITIHWNRELEQILHGPHGGWMFETPANGFLEVAPHSLSQMVDLMGGAPDQFHVRADRLHAIDSKRSCHRRWVADAVYGSTLVRLVWSLIPGYADHRVEVQGSLGSATADCEQWTYQRNLHSPYQADFNRFHMTRNAGKSLVRQSWGNLFRYMAEKLHLSSQGHLYAKSLRRTAEAFYSEVRGQVANSPISLERARAVVDLSFAMADEAIESEKCDASSTYAVATESPAATNQAASATAGNATASQVIDNTAIDNTAVVLGATGFIGRHLVDKLLDDGRDVRVVVRDQSAFDDHPLRRKIDVCVGDLRDVDVVRKSVCGANVVYHLARAYGNTWDDFAANDLPLTRALAEESLKAGVKRFVYTGTIDSYYAGSRQAITEETPLDPKIHWRKPYSRAKAQSENELLEMFREKGLPLVIFRPGIVLGRGATPYHWGVGMFHQGAVVHLWGDGENTLPLVLAQDVASAMAASFDTEGIEGEVFNLSGPPLMTAKEYVAAIESIAGVKFQVRPTAISRYYAADMFKYFAKVLVRHPGRYCPSYRDWKSRTQLSLFDCAKAQRLLGWNPESNLEAFVERAIREPAEEYLF